MSKAKTDPRLLALLENMSGRNDTQQVKGSETTSWQAYRIAEKVNDLSMVSTLLDFAARIEDKNLKKEAYQLLCFILKNTKDASLAHTLLEKIKQEDNDKDSLYTLLMGLWDSKANLSKNIDIVIYYVDDERHLIRNAALRVISLFKSDIDKAEKALIDVIENNYDNYDLRYAIQGIAQIGTLEAIPVLENIDTHDSEIKQVVSESIKKIKTNHLA